MLMTLNAREGDVKHVAILHLKQWAAINEYVELNLIYKVTKAYITLNLF